MLPTGEDVLLGPAHTHFQATWIDMQADGLREAVKIHDPLDGFS